MSRILRHYLPFDEAKDLILSQMEGMDPVRVFERVLPGQHPMDLKCQMAAAVCAGLTGGQFVCGTAIHRHNYLPGYRSQRAFHCWVIGPNEEKWDPLEDFYFGHIEDSQEANHNIHPGALEPLLTVASRPGLASDYIPWWRQERGI